MVVRNFRNSSAAFDSIPGNAELGKAIREEWRGKDGLRYTTMRLYLESLGCARNQVDSEIMRGRLSEAGWEMAQEPDSADVIVVNTCSFIESAVDESIDTILELARFKEKGSCRRLIVAGCLPERYRDDVLSTLPEVDCFLGTGAYDAIIEAAGDDSVLSPCHLPDPNLAVLPDKDTPRAVASSAYAYVKISDGCNRHCTYCIIPKVRGRQKSRGLADIVGEAGGLVSAGIKELVLVAQDTTAWGKDLKPPVTFSRLLRELSGIGEQVRIRILYGHPNSIDRAAIHTVADCANICAYLDIPVQHASNNVLKRMGRFYRREELLTLYGYLRSVMPDVALRTSIMVGFPGETDDDFDLLFDFVKTVRFDHLGVFTYSDADDLDSHGLPDPVPPDIALDRHHRIMSYQRQISEEILGKYIGRTMPVLVEENPEADLFIGRTEYQAPEVDGITYIRTGGMPEQPLLNRLIRVRIKNALEYDLIGEPE